MSKPLNNNEIENALRKILGPLFKVESTNHGPVFVDDYQQDLQALNKYLKEKNHDSENSTKRCPDMGEKNT